jgi:hypothetical protein
MHSRFRTGLLAGTGLILAAGIAMGLTFQGAPNLLQLLLTGTAGTLRFNSGAATVQVVDNDATALQFESVDGTNLFHLSTANGTETVIFDAAVTLAAASLASLDVTGLTTLDQTQIDTTDGAFALTGTNDMTIGGSVDVSLGDSRAIRWGASDDMDCFWTDGTQTWVCDLDGPTATAAFQLGTDVTGYPQSSISASVAPTAE